MSVHKTKHKFLKTSTSIALVTSAIVTAIPAQATENKGFSDLTSTNTHFDNINQLLERGIINGFPDGSYRPSDAVTRGQAAKIIASTLKLKPTKGNTQKFKDVPTNHQYYQSIAALVENGIINGYSDQTFKPNGYVTRGQMAKMIARAFNLTASSFENPFTDIPNNHEYYSYITALYEAKITTGKNDTTFDMKSSVTRGQMASFVVRAEKNLHEISNVKGAIQEINENGIVINDATYKVPTEFLFLTEKNNYDALKNAQIELTVKNDEITSIKKLSLTETAKNFDAFNATFEQLYITNSLTNVKNVNSKSIHFENVKEDVSLNNVKASNVLISTKNTVASLNQVTTGNSANVSINDSAIDQLTIDSREANISENNSDIKKVTFKNGRSLTLNGKFNDIYTNGDTALNGTATITAIHWLNNPLNSFVPSTLKISNATYNSKTYTWAEAVKQFLISTNSEETGGTSSNSGSNTSNGGSDGTSPNNGGSTGGSGSSNNGGNAGGGSSNNGGNTSGETPSDNNGNTGNNGSDESIKTETEEITSPSISVNNGNVTIQTTENNQSVTYTVENPALQQLFISNKENIDNVSFVTVNNVITSINSLKLTTNDFDGASLNQLDKPIETLILNATKNIEVANIEKIDNLVINGKGTVDLKNTTTKSLTIEGDVAKINGGSSDVLVIKSTAALVEVNTNAAKETIIPEKAQPKLFSRVASLSNMFANTVSTTTMEITFSGNASQTLTIERSDVKVNLEGEPFSRINIKNNGVDIAAESSKAHIYVSNGVSQLSLNADVSEFTLNLEQPIVISSNTARTINTLNIKTTKSNSEVKEWIELINVTATSVTYDPTSLTDDVFKKPSIIVSEPFSSSASYVKLGYYAINFTKNAGSEYYYKLIDENDSVDNYKNLTANQAKGFTKYEDSHATQGIYVPANNTAVMVFEITNSNDVRYSIAPVDQSKYLLFYATSGNSLTVVSRFADNQSPAQHVGQVHVFKNGSLAKSVDATSWQKNATYGNEYNTLTFNSLGVSLDGKRELYISKSYASGSGINFTTNENDFVNALKTLATIAKNTGETAYFEQLLKVVAANKNLSYNSFFLSKYIEQIATNSGQYTTLSSFQTLFDAVEQEHSYDRDATLTAEQLFLTGSITTNFTYSTNGIIKNALSDDGKLTFTGLAAGSTTLRVEDTNGNATLINVTVDANKKVTVNPTTNVLKAEITAGTLLDGQNSFRSITDNGKLYILPTKLAKASAIIETTGTPSSVNRVTVLPNGASYTISNETEITPKSIEIKDFGLQNVSILASENIFGKVSGTALLLYPRYEGEESIFVGNATKSTAVYVKTSTNVEATIAASANKLNIENDLHLGAFVIEKDAGTDKVHIFDDNGEIQLFANDAASGHFIFTDNSNDNNKAIVNYSVSNTNGKVTVDTFELLQRKLGENKPNVVIVNVSGNSVRYVGNTILAVRKGLSIVTMSDGTQYEVAVGQTGETYTLNVEEVTNIELKADDLHMTDITSAVTVDDTAQSQPINNKKSLLVRLSGDKTSTFTLTSSIGEKAVVHITKSGTGYTKVVDRSEITKDDLQLTNAISDVIESPQDIKTSRAAFDNEKVYIYNLNKGTRTFRVTDGTNSTALNVTVDKDANNRLTSTPAVITHKVNGTIDGTVTSNAARLVGDTLYATGLGIVNNEAIIAVPLENGATYNVALQQNATTGLYSFNDNATVSYSYTINKNDLGLDTLTTATAPNSNVTAAIDGNDVIITINNDSEGRVRVNGTNGSETAAAYVHFKRVDADGQPTITVEKFDVVEKLSDYGLISSSSVIATRPNIARLATNSDLSSKFFALDAGTTGFEVKDTTGKVALFNVTVTAGTEANKLRSLNAQVVRHEFTTDENVTATIIEGDAVRIHNNFVYAIKNSGTAKVKLSNGKVIQYSVELDTNGQYVLTPTELANTATVDANSIGLSGNISATGFDSSIVSVTEYNDTLTLIDATTSTDNTVKQTSAIVTDAAGNKSIINIEVGSDKKITVSPAVSTTADAPKLIHAADSSIVRIVGNTIFAVGQGTATLFVENKIQQVTVTKANGQYTISEPKTISSSVFTATDLGFDNNANMVIESIDDSSVAYVGLFDKKVIAYSKLTDTTGAAEFTVKASDSSLRTLVRVTDDGTNFTHQLAVQDYTFASVPTIADETIVRYKDGKLYSFATGHTYATVDNRLHAISVSRVSQHLTAAVEPLKHTVSGSPFTAIANETNTNIVEIAGDTIYAKGLGQTKVKNGDTVYNVNISNSNGPLTMVVTPIVSKTVTATELGLSTLKAAAIVQNTDVLTLNRTDDSITIYSKGTPTAQSLAVKVTDTNNHHAIINVTIDENGTVSSATVAKEELTMLLSANDTKQTAKARAVWQDNKLTVYALEAGKTKFAFDDALINIETNANGNLLDTINISPLAHSIAITEEITNGDIINEHYVTNTGTALVHTDSLVFNVNVEALADEYKLVKSTGVPFKTLDVTDSTFVVSGTGTKATTYDTNASALVIYKDGVGTTDITITSGGKKTVHHVKSDTNGLTDPKLAKANLTDLPVLLTNAKLLDDTTENSMLRLENDALYYLAEGSSTFKLPTNRLVNVQVTRDSNQFFTSTPAFVSTELQQAPTSLTSSNFELDGTTVYALNGVAAKEVFYSADYRIALQTIEDNGKHSVKLDERKMKQFDFSQFGLTGTVSVTEGGNTKPTVAKAEVENKKIVIYAGDEVGTTNITMTDGATTVTFIATVDEDGNIVVTPQASLNVISFEKLELTNSTDNPISVNNLKPEIMSVAITETGLNIIANKTGQGSIEVKQGGVTVAIVNVSISQNTNGQFIVTATPLTFETTGTSLISTASSRPSTALANTYFVTSSGYFFYGKAENVAYYAQVKLGTDRVYSLTESTHTLQKYSAAQLDLDTITSASVTGSIATVDKLINTAKNELYIFGLNDGQADVTVKGTKDGNIVSAIITTENGSTLAANIAHKAALAGTWKKATGYNEIANVRNGQIYAITTGKSVYEDTSSAVKKLSNITITRNANLQYDISMELLAKDYSGKTVSVINGSSVAVEGSTIYAQEEGTSTIKVDDKYYSVTVSKKADELFKLEVSTEAIVQATLSAADLGVDTITNTTIQAITGAGVVTTQIKENELIIYAKNTGQAEIRINDNPATTNADEDETETIIHVLVTETANKLVITPTIAKVALTGAQTVQSQGLFRGENNMLYALGEGHEVALVNDELYNLVASKVNNVLKVTADRIELSFDKTVTNPTDGTVIKVEDKKVIALKAGTSDVTVDGQTYRITVGADGSIKKDLVQAATINVNEALPAITKVNSTLTDATFTGTTITLEPKANATGTEIVTVENGTESIQVKVTVTLENGTQSVVSEIVKQTFNTASFGFSPLVAKLPDGTVFKSTNGVIKVDNLVATIYPGAPGTSYAIIEGSEQQAIYTLNVENDFTTTFTPFTQTISYNEFNFLPNVLASTGSAKAIGNDTNGLTVEMKDFLPSMFIVQGDSSNYKQVTVQATHTNNEVTATTPIVNDVHVVTGKVSAASNNLKTVEHSDKTVIYTDTNTPATGYYTVNDVIYNVAITDNLTIAATRVEKDAESYTTAQHLFGEDIATIINDGSSNKWVAKAAGTGIYKVDSDYVQVTVTKNADDTFSMNISDTFAKGSLVDTTLKNLTVIQPESGLFIDGHTIFGTVTNNISLKAMKDGKPLLYKGTVTDKTISFTLQEENILTELNWSSYKTHDLNAASTVVRIEGDKLYPIGVGSENITFTSENGVSKTINVTVDENFNTTITATTKNVITYSTNTDNGWDLVTYTLTFDLNINENINIELDAATVGNIYVDGNTNKITIVQQAGIQKVYNLTLSLPELNNEAIPFKMVVNNGADHYIENNAASTIEFKKTN